MILVNSISKASGCPALLRPELSWSHWTAARTTQNALMGHRSRGRRAAPPPRLPPRGADGEGADLHVPICSGAPGLAIAGLCHQMADRAH